MHVQFSDDSQSVMPKKGFWVGKYRWAPDLKLEDKYEEADVLFFFSSTSNSLRLYAH